MRRLRQDPSPGGFTPEILAMNWELMQSYDGIERHPGTVMGFDFKPSDLVLGISDDAWERAKSGLNAGVPVIIEDRITSAD